MIVAVRDDVNVVLVAVVVGDADLVLVGVVVGVVDGEDVIVEAVQFSKAPAVKKEFVASFRIATAGRQPDCGTTAMELPSCSWRLTCSPIK